MTQLKNNKGLTLVEILAAIVITSIVAVFIASILQSTTKQNVEQQQATKQLTNATFILKTVTRDFRRSTEFEIVNSKKLELIQPSASGDVTVTYEMVEVDATQQLQKTSSSGTETEIIAQNIGCFYVGYIGDQDKQNLELKVSANPAVTDCINPSEKEKKDIKATTIQMRLGDT